MEVQDRTFAELTTAQLLRLLKLRSEVFVVEQNCVYLDIDGRDEEPATRHIWLEQEQAITACLRLLQDSGAQRIGRVVTAPDHRGQRHAARLMQHVLDTSTGPWVLSAQAHLEAWYQEFGFTRQGENYLEDGIPHLSMERPAMERLAP